MKGAVELLGGGEYFAAIVANYPDGAICTCTDGEKTFTADSDGTAYIFAIPYAGTWTVTIKKSENYTGKSKVFEITEEGQVESATLTFELILFDGGDNTEITGGWDYDGRETEPIVSDKLGLDIDDEVTSAKDDNHWILATVNTIDLSGYTKLCANITGVDYGSDPYGYGDGAWLCVGNGVAWNTTLKAKQSISGAGKVELDISGVNSGHVGLYLQITSNGYAQLIGSVYASKIWLE